MTMKTRSQSRTQPEGKRSVGLQTITNSRIYVSPKAAANANHEFKEYSPLFYRPHTLTSLVALLATLWLLSQGDFLVNMARNAFATGDVSND